MIINETLVKYIFNKQNILKYFAINMILIISMFAISFIVIVNSYIVIYKQYKDTIENVNVSYNYNISEASNNYKESMQRCLAINCERVVLKDENDYDVYKIEYDMDTQFNYLKLVDDEIFHTIWFTQYLTSEFRMVIYGEHGIYIMNDNNYLESTLNTIFLLGILFAVIIIVINFYAAYHSFKNDIYEKKNYKTYIENKLQGNVTEMIHHEINAPLSILISTSYLIRGIIEHKSTVSQEDIDKIMDSYNYSINRISEVITFLAKSKYFKRDDNVTIYDSIEHIIYSINTTHILKLGIKYDDCEKILNNFIIDPNLGHAGFMNIITVLFNNSIEAGANLMTISVPSYTDTHLTLDVKDNGRGIRDSNGNLFKDSGHVISQYGYSTKDDKGKPIVRTGLLYRIFKLFRIKLITTDTTRGIGLYMNKVLLENAHGTINLHSTSDEGTTFRLKIPIKHKNA